MSPNNYLQLWTALKLHFNSPQYDYFRYNGCLKNPPKFEKRHDKHFFSWLQNKPDPKGLMIANLIKNPNIWIGDLFNSEAQANYEEYKKRAESLTYIFSEDLEKIRGLVPNCFWVKDGQHPELLQLYLRNDISIDTMVILNDFLGYIQSWDKYLKDDPIWLSCRLPLIKYRPFMNYDKAKLFCIFKKIVLDNIEGLG